MLEYMAANVWRLADAEEDKMPFCAEFTSRMAELRVSEVQDQARQNEVSMYDFIVRMVQMAYSAYIGIVPLLFK